MMRSVPPRFVAGMVNNAVVGKELRTRMRGWRSMVVLTTYMTILGATAIAYLLRETGPSASQSSQAGIQLFVLLSIFQLFLIVFVTPSSTASAISGERQRLTWDLLLVTRLSSLGIVWGKLFAGLAFNLLLILASLPLFSLVFLFGGVAPDDVLHTYVVFLATVLLLGVTSLFISALTRRLVVSMVVSNVISLTFTVGLSLLTVYLEATGQQAAGPAGSPATPSLTPLAELDPLLALLSALPNGNGGTILGGSGHVRHAFALPWDMQLWESYAWLAVTTSLVLFLVTAVLVRAAPPWLTRSEP